MQGKTTKQMVVGSADFSAKTGLSPIANYLLKLGGKSRPKVCYVGTAAGDEITRRQRFYEACASSNIQASHLQLFTKPNYEDIKKHLLSQDIIWVAGGSTANLLAVWEVHGVMDIMREANANGTILSGYSAGCVCWSLGGTTDSFGETLRLLINKKSDVLLPHSVCVHYDVEPGRRPLNLKLIKDGALPAGYATEEGVTVHFIDGKLHKVVSDTPGKFAYYVYKDKTGRVIEDKLTPELLS